MKQLLKPNGERIIRKKNVIKRNYDRKAKNLPKLKTGKSVYFEHQKQLPLKQGTIIDMNDRKYVVKSSDGTVYKRNSIHVKPTELEVRQKDISPHSIPETRPSAAHVENTAPEPDRSSIIVPSERESLTDLEGKLNHQVISKIMLDTRQC